MMEEVEGVYSPCGGVSMGGIKILVVEILRHNNIFYFFSLVSSARLAQEFHVL